MSTMKFMEYDLVKDKNGKLYYKTRIVEKDITGKEDRIYKACRACEHGYYPKCLDHCASARFSKIQQERKQK